jgi:hypothetical protein
MFLLALGMYWPPGSQMVAPAVAASSPGIPKRPMFAWSAAGSVAATKVRIGYWAPLPSASSLMP